MKPKFFPPLCLSFLTINLSAQETTSKPDDLTPTQLAEMVVTGKAEDLIGMANTASEGEANSEELSERPYLRRGELLEVVPGVIITQHSGDGKANQYFVRGFNLDHGTDFNISMDGQPVNFVTHAHGQGYADLNPIIPELVEILGYWKGPFYGQIGDLSTAGAARFNFFNELPQGIASLGFGQHNYFHALLADSIELNCRTGCKRFAVLQARAAAKRPLRSNLRRRVQLLRRTMGQGGKCPTDQRVPEIFQGSRRGYLQSNGHGV